MKILKWVNVHSKEFGYVKSVSPKNKCFINTFDEASAKRYKSDTLVNKDLEMLKEFGEAENNEFSVVEVAG